MHRIEKLKKKLYEMMYNCCEAQVGIKIEASFTDNKVCFGVLGVKMMMR